MFRKPDQPQHWSVHAEFTISHPGAADPDNGAHAETRRDENGVRMTYTWASQVNNNPSSSSIWGAQSNVPSAPSSTSGDSTPKPFSCGESSTKSFGDTEPRGYGFQRGNMLFTAIPPAKRPYVPPSGTNPSISSKQKQDSSGYGSDMLSPNSFASGSLPRRVIQPFNRKCKSTCNIVLSTNIQEETEEAGGASQCGRTLSLRCQTPTARCDRRTNFYGCGDPWCHHSNYGDELAGSGRFSPVPEMCEECPSVQTAVTTPRASRASTFTTHCCDRATRGSAARDSDRRDACVQTFDMIDKCTSPFMKMGSFNFKRDNEPKKKYGPRRRTEPVRQRSRSPSSYTPDSLDNQPRRVLRSPKQKKIPAVFQQEKTSSLSDSKSSDPSKKPRTVHIDVYCTGTEMESNASSSSSDASDNETASTPQTVFESSAMRVTHARAEAKDLPRSIQNTLLSVSKPRTLQTGTSKEESDVDDASVGYPSKMSSYSTIKDYSSSISSMPRSWTSYSMSSCTVPDDCDSIANTSWKDTFSDIDSLVQSRSSIAPADSFDFVPRRLYDQTPSIDEAPEFASKRFLPTPSSSSLQQSDSFEYANSEDKLRIRRMEEMLTKPAPTPWKAPGSERKQLMRQKKINDYVERRLKALSKSSKSKDSDSDGSDEDEKGWTFIKDDNKKLERDTTVRRASKDMEEKATKRPETIVEESSQEKQTAPLTPSTPTKTTTFLNKPKLTEQGSLSDSSSSCSKSPSGLTLRQRLSADPMLRSPFTILPGLYTEQRTIARKFGPVVGAFKKPGHHVGPAKNPDCLCDHCRRFFEENGHRNRTRSLGDPPITPIQNWRDFIKSVNPPESAVKKPPHIIDF